MTAPVTRQYSHNKLDLFANVAVEHMKTASVQKGAGIRKAARKHATASELEQGIAADKPLTTVSTALSAIDEKDFCKV